MIFAAILNALADALAAISKHFHKLSGFSLKGGGREGGGRDICFLNTRPPSLHPTCEQALIIIVSGTTQTGSSKVSPKTQLRPATFSPIWGRWGSEPTGRSVLMAGNHSANATLTGWAGITNLHHRSRETSAPRVCGRDVLRALCCCHGYRLHASN